MRAGLALLLLATTAAAPDKPAIIPLRDVDVTYRMVQPIEGGPVLAQRMRWLVAAGKLRVDPPSPALYVIVDYKAKRMVVVHPADRTVLDAEAPGAALPASASGTFGRLGPDQVLGEPCTNWQTSDSGGKTVVVCLTADGVMLRATQGTNILLEATALHYGPQDPAAFVSPGDFRHVQQAAR